MKIRESLGWILALAAAAGIMFYAGKGLCHGTHTGTGPTIGVKAGLFGSRYLMITAGERDDRGSLTCDHIKHIFWVTKENDEKDHPAIHLIETLECSEWDNL
jgi:hypothetical protein